MDLRSDDLRTLQFGPLWVLSALAGTSSRFDADELQAFWDTLVQVSLRSPEPIRAVLTSLAVDRSGLLLAYELDDQPVVSGLSRVAAVLKRLEPAFAEDFRLALLRIGMAVGRARGPYGRRLTFEDSQLLLLLAQLIEIETVPTLGDDVLV